MSGKTKNMNAEVLHVLKINYVGDFFSSCVVKLVNLVEYVNENKKHPDFVDGSLQFREFETPEPEAENTFFYFKDYLGTPIPVAEKNIPFSKKLTSTEYVNLPHTDLEPLLTRYFTLSKNVTDLVDDIEKKNVFEYEHICGIVQNSDISISKYEEELDKFLSKDQKRKFLVYSNDSDFSEYFAKKYPDKCLYFKSDGEKHPIVSLASLSIISRSKHVILGTGDLEMWVVLMRKSFDGVKQWIGGKWHFTEKKRRYFTLDHKLLQLTTNFRDYCGDSVITFCEKREKHGLYLNYFKHTSSLYTRHHFDLSYTKSDLWKDVNVAYYDIDTEDFLKKAETDLEKLSGGGLEGMFIHINLYNLGDVSKLAKEILLGRIMSKLTTIKTKMCVLITGISREFVDTFKTETKTGFGDRLVEFYDDSVLLTMGVNELLFLVNEMP